MDASSALGAKTSTAGATQAGYLANSAQPQYSTIGTGLMGLSQNQQFTNAVGGWLKPTTSPYDPMSRYTSGSLGSGD
jgi:hypothetical protein